MGIIRLYLNRFVYSPFMSFGVIIAPRAHTLAIHATVRWETTNRLAVALASIRLRLPCLSLATALGTAPAHPPASPFPPKGDPFLSLAACSLTVFLSQYKPKGFFFSLFFFLGGVRCNMFIAYGHRPATEDYILTGSSGGTIYCLTGHYLIRMQHRTI